MTGLRWLLLACALVGLSQGAPSPAGHVVHEKRDLSEGNGWKRADRIHSSAILPVRIALAQGNLDNGHDLLMELSHPSSSKYGQWWSAEEVHEYFSPAEEAVTMVKEWIKSAGISGSRIIHHENKGWLSMNATVEEAERLMKTTFHEYHHPSSDRLMIGTDSYHIPEHLADHIDYIVPAVKMSLVRKSNKYRMKRNVERSPANLKPLGISIPDHSRPDNLVENLLGDLAGDTLTGLTDSPQIDPSLKDCVVNMTASCLRAMYSIPENPIAVECNEMGVFEDGDYIDKPDLDLYYANFASWVPQGTYPVPALIDGADYDRPQNDTANIVGEALIDIALSTALIYPQKVILYQTDDPIYAQKMLYDPGASLGIFDTFLDALDGSYCKYYTTANRTDDMTDPLYPNPDPSGYQGQLMCGVFEPTKVISLSYAFLEYPTPPRYQKRLCNEFLKLGLRGTSIVAGSGDTGVAGFTGAPGAQENGCLGPKGAIFSPGGPVTCPYVTAVGGTMVWAALNQTIFDAESVMDDTYFAPGPVNFTSGGGFSNLFPRPSYQEAAVQNYLDNHVPPYPYYEQLDPDFSKVEGYYNRIGRAFPDVATYSLDFQMYQWGNFTRFYGTSVSAPIFGSILTLLNQERALAGKGSIGFVNPALYAFPEVLNDVTNGTNFGCGTLGFPAAPGWDGSTGLGSPNYPKMRDLWLALP